MRKNLLTILVGLSVLSLFSCTRILHYSNAEVQVYNMDDSLSLSDSYITSLISPYKSALDAEMNIVIGQCAKTLERVQPESTLGNWMADAIHVQAENYFGTSIDFAIQNHYGIRVPNLAEGPVTKGSIFELMPFRNHFVLLHLKGDVVQTFFNHIASLGGWPVSKTVRFEINEGFAQNVQIKGKNLDSNQIYTLVLPDYIANGGDNCNFLENYVKRTDSEHLIRNALMDYISKNPLIDGNLEGRISQVVIAE